MDINDIHYTHDMLTAIGEALAARDGEKLQDLQRRAENWMLPEAESAGWTTLFMAVVEAAYDLEMHEARDAA
jgi:hypothetical protein